MGLTDVERARISTLLPVELQHILDSPVDSEERRSLHRYLARLLAALRATLPVWLLDDLERRRATLAHGGDATLLLADITDFTPITARLELLGRVGNDIMTQVVNGFFDAMVGTAYTWDGDVLAYGGDALLIAYTGTQHAARAAAAAVEMQRAVESLPPIPLPSAADNLRLRMKIGIAGGALVRASVGTPDRRVALALGRVLYAADRMASATHAGGIRLNPVAARGAAGVARLTPDHASYLLDELTDMPARADRRSPHEHAMPIGELIHAIFRLAPYLPRDVLAELAASPGERPGDGEQRKVISVFIQLAGLNEISDALAPERAAEIAAIAADALVPCLDTIERAGGVLARVDTYANGHKLLALFGAPRAGEHDADWAVWAALRLREQLPAITAAVVGRAQQAGAMPDALAHKLTLRAGINAGQVVTALVGSGTRYEYTIMGDSANVAARLMGQADPLRSEILLGPGVHEQLRETVDAVDRGPIALKGKPAPIPIWEVRGIRPRSWRAPSSAPLVGRVAERAALGAVAAALRSGRRGVVLLRGEAGVGKTRLRQELHDMLRESVTRVVVNPPGRAAPAYGALRGLLRAVCAIPPEATPDQARDQLRELLASYGIGDDDALLAALEFLVGAAEEPFVPRREDESALRLAFAGLLRRLLLLIAAHHPLALFIEDLHELDGDSLAVLEQLMLLGWDAPLLLCATLRPGTGQASAAQRVCDAALERFDADARLLEVGKLDTASGEELLDALISGLAPAARSALLDHAGANPLFLELLTQRIEQQGALRPDPHGQGLVLRVPLDRLRLPATLRELVVAQLDVLPPAVRRIARAAAVLAAAGRTFTRLLLEQIAGDPPAVAARLEELERSQVIVPAPGVIESFSFRHPLFQSEAYRLLQSHERRELHRRAAEALDTDTTPDDARSEMLAYHYRQGQVWDRTLVWSLEAGTRARRVYANDRAYAHLRRSLWLARRSGAARQATSARIELGELLSLTGRWEQARAHLAAALELAPAAGSSPGQVELLARCHRLLALVAKRVAASDADYDEAEAHCRTGLDLLIGSDMGAIEVSRLHAAHAEILTRRNAYDDAVRAVRAGLAALPDGPKGRRERARLEMRLAAIEGRRERYAVAIEGLEHSLELIGDEDMALRAAIIDNRGIYLQRSNNFDEALKAFHQSLDLQRRIEDLDGQISTLINLGGLYHTKGNFDQALACYAEAQSICERLKLQEPLAFTLNNIGIAQFFRAQIEDAKTYHIRALEIFRNLKLEGDSIDPLYRLGEIALARGEAEEALSYGTEALDLAQRLGLHIYKSCALRVIGDALLQQGALAEAAHHLNEAWELQGGDEAEQTEGDTFDQALILASLARLALALGDCAQARKRVAAGLRLARKEELPYPISLLEALQQQIDERCGTSAE